MAKNGQSMEQVTVTVLSVVMMRVFLYSYFNNATNFLYEMMSRNIINLFSTPLTFNEWLCGAMVSGLVSTMLLVVFSTVVAWSIFGISLVSAGPILVIFIIPLLISGWAVSHATILILMFFGVHAQRLAWVLGWLFIPFSGVYYSLDIMPTWIQKVSQVVPMSYIFSSLRAFMLEGKFSAESLMWGYFLALFYFMLTTIACNRMFERSRQLGLASLERS
jgi:ABC-2 type transport system permease protein